MSNHNAKKEIEKIISELQNAPKSSPGGSLFQSLIDRKNALNIALFSMNKMEQAMRELENLRKNKTVPTL